MAFFLFFSFHSVMSSIIFNRLMNYTNNYDQKIIDLEKEEFNNNNNEDDDDQLDFEIAGCQLNSLNQMRKKLEDYQENFIPNIIANERLDCLVLSLYNNNEFCLSIKHFNSDAVSDRISFFCDPHHIFSFIEHEELPPKLVDIIEMFQFRKFFFNGCVVCEIQDDRQLTKCELIKLPKFILLKPTNLTLYNDVKKIIGLTNRAYLWTKSTRLKLESKLIHLSSPSLQLEPNSLIDLLSKKLSSKQKLIGSKILFGKKATNLATTNSISFVSKNDSFKKEFKLLQYLKRRKLSPKIKTAFSSERFSPDSSSSSSNLVLEKTLPNFQFKDVEKLAKEIKKNQTENDEDLIKKEEFKIELLDMPGHTTRLIFSMRPIDGTYHGELISETIANGQTSKGSVGFFLGSEEAKYKYINQFIETFSENGKKRLWTTRQKGEDEFKPYKPANDNFITRQLSTATTITNHSNQSDNINHSNAIDSSVTTTANRSKLKIINKTEATSQTIQTFQMLTQLKDGLNEKNNQNDMNDFADLSAKDFIVVDHNNIKRETPIIKANVSGYQLVVSQPTTFGNLNNIHRPAQINVQTISSPSLKIPVSFSQFQKQQSTLTTLLKPNSSTYGQQVTGALQASCTATSNKSDLNFLLNNNNSQNGQTALTMIKEEQIS